MCCESAASFKATQGFGVVVKGGKLTAWFPHIAGERDYASNPPNSICSNEYVCVSACEGGNESVYDKKGKSNCLKLNVHFGLAVETHSAPSHKAINQTSFCGNALKWTRFSIDWQILQLFSLKIHSDTVFKLKNPPIMSKSDSVCSLFSWNKTSLQLLRRWAICLMQEFLFPRGWTLNICNTLLFCTF